MPTSRRFGLSVALVSDGALVDEYAVQEDVEQRRVSCFVSSEHNKTFEIYFTNELTKQQVCLYVYIDNISVGCFFLGPGSKKLPALYESQTTASLLRFRQDNYSSPNSPQFLGTLEFRAYRCTKSGSTTFRSQHGNLDLEYITNIGRAGEPMKNRAHRVACAPPTPLPQSVSAVTGHLDDPLDQPYASFVFRYGPRELLAAQGILPAVFPCSRLPSPTCTDPDTGFEVYTPPDGMSLGPLPFITDYPLHPVPRSHVGPHRHREYENDRRMAHPYPQASRRHRAPLHRDLGLESWSAHEDLSGMLSGHPSTSSSSLNYAKENSRGLPPNKEETGGSSLSVVKSEPQDDPLNFSSLLMPALGMGPEARRGCSLFDEELPVPEPGQILGSADKGQSNMSEHGLQQPLHGMHEYAFSYNCSTGVFSTVGSPSEDADERW